MAPPTDRPQVALLPDLCLPDLGCPPPLGEWNGEGPTRLFHLALKGEERAEDVASSPQAEGKPPTWSRRIGSMTGVASFYGALYAWAYFAWYRGRPKNPRIIIHWEGGFGSQTYAGGADKLGHYFSSYAIARGTTEFMTHMGWSPWISTLAGGLLSLTWFTAIELKDGMHKGFGFSPEDMLANTLGVLTSALMVLWPAVDDLFDVRLYYRPSKLFTDELLYKRNVDVAEDYTGMTFLLALRLMGIPWIRNTRWVRHLRFVDVLMGYNARGFLPRPTNGRWRERELFFGFGLNLVAILEDAVPGSRLHRTINVMQEYFHLTPVHRFVRVRAYDPQPQKPGQWKQGH